MLSDEYVTLHCKTAFADIIQVDLKLGRVSWINQVCHISIVGALEKKGLSPAGRRGEVRDSKHEKNLICGCWLGEEAPRARATRISVLRRQ